MQQPPEGRNRGNCPERPRILGESLRDRQVGMALSFLFNGKVDPDFERVRIIPGNRQGGVSGSPFDHVYMPVQAWIMDPARKVVVVGVGDAVSDLPAAEKNSYVHGDYLGTD